MMTNRSRDIVSDRLLWRILMVEVETGNWKVETTRKTLYSLW